MNHEAPVMTVADDIAIRALLERSEAECPPRIGRVQQYHECLFVDCAESDFASPQEWDWIIKLACCLAAAAAIIVMAGVAVAGIIKILE